jgi:hypothetical protein
MSLQYDPNGTIVSEMPLQGKPWDVCLVNPFTVAVSLPNNKPWNMSYVSTIAIVDTIHMKTGISRTFNDIACYISGLD